MSEYSGATPLVSSAEEGSPVPPPSRLSLVTIPAAGSPPLACGGAGVDPSDDGTLEVFKRAMVPSGRASDAVILNTAFAPVEDEEGWDGSTVSRIAKTETLCWGRGDLGQLMQPELGGSAVPIPAPRLDSLRVVSVACSPYHTLVVTDTGELLASGLNDEGQLFAGTGQDCVRQPQHMDTVSTQRIIAVATGTSHTAVLLSTHAVLTFGNNEYGQLGHSPDKPSNVGPRAMLGMGSGQRRVIQIACGDEHTVLLTTTGEVYTCGNGVHGALGHGHRTSVTEPKRVAALAGVPLVQVSAGGYHTVAVTRTGQAYSWGRNRYGQLGLGSKDHSVVHPTRLTSMPRLVQQAACGHDHTMFLTVCGEMYGCGRGTSGQLGIGEATEFQSLDAVLTPVRVLFPGDNLPTPAPLAEPAPEPIISPIAARPGLPAASSDQGAIVTLPDVHDSPMKHKVTHSHAAQPNKARQVACGSRHTIVLTVAGDVYVFGSNGEGQLGIGVLEEECVFTPVLVPTLSRKGVFFVGAGGDSSAAVRVTRGSVLSTAPGSLPRGVLTSIDASTLLVNARVAAASQNFTQLKQIFREVFSSLSCISASFLARAEHKYYITLSDASLLNTSLFTDFRVYPHAHTLEDVDGAAPAPTPLVLEAASGCYEAADGWSEIEHWRLSSSLGVEGFDVAMSVVASLRSPEIRDSLLKSLMDAVTQLEEADGALEPDALRPILTMLLLPVFEGPSAPQAALVYDRLLHVVNALPTPLKSLLGTWILHDVASPLFVSRLVDSALSYISLYVSTFLRSPEDKQGQYVGALRTVLAYLSMLNSLNTTAKLCQPSKFYSQAVSELPDEVLKSDYIRWLQSRTNPEAFTFCKYAFLFDADAKRRVLHIDVEARQAMEMQSALVRHILLGEEPFLVLRVRRTNIVDDTVTILRRTGPAMYKKPLKVVFEGEEGVDAGGVTKEFFQLLSQALFDPSFGMFVTMPATNTTWFNVASPRDADRDFELIGTLVGLAIYNRVLLDLHFPMCVYKKLLSRPLGLEELAEVDPEVATSMRSLLEYKADDVEDVFCLNFTASYEDMGAVRTVPLRRGGASVTVTQDNKREFVAAYIKWYLVDSIDIQFRNFARGFLMVLDGPVLEMFGPEELSACVCGTPELNFMELEKVAEYEGYARTDPPIKFFWSVVHTLPPALLTKLLLFITGCAKAPIGGLGRLRMKIQRNGVDSERLPTASTCFNTLLLPPYGSEAKMRDRLLTAIENCAGFGLQ